tara:strand:+ start:3161 stop:3937 length:777 start_codon:yes stop_codon:yes gene_type:complete
VANKIKISRRREYKEQLKAYINLSKNLNAKLKRLFKKISRKASFKYSEGLMVDDIMFLEFGDELYKLLANHYRLVIGITASRIIKVRKKQDNEIDTIVEEYIINNTAQKVTQISSTTRALLATTIAAGIAEGLGSEDMGKLIQRSIAFAPYRATMISRTETHTAQNYTGSVIAKVLRFKNPVKAWVSALDDRTRSWHVRMDNKVIPENDKFEVITPISNAGSVVKYMDFCGDPNGGASNVINCRCQTQYYDEEDEILR